MKAFTSFCTGVLINLVTFWYIAPTDKFVVPIEPNKVEIKQLPVFYGSILGYETVRNTLLLRYIELDTQIQSNNYLQFNEILKQKQKIIDRLKNE